MPNTKTFPHRRYNPLSGQWVMVSPQRNLRPWQGQQEKLTTASKPSYDADCYLCPTNERITKAVNPAYSDTYVFDNDFPALLPNKPVVAQSDNPLFRSETVEGKCRVICFSPDHSKTLAQLEQSSIKKVIDTWVNECETLGEIYSWVQVFENKGSAMGCSNPHPHGQIWASNFIPTEVSRADHFQKTYYNDYQSHLLLDYVRKEQEEKVRIVEETEYWLCVVPYWAAWPFETLILPKQSVKRITELSEQQRQDFAKILQLTTIRYDNLFQCDFPYSMGIHGAPFDDQDYSYWQMHVHFYPPLLRSATVKKFMVGYEMMAEAQRDLTPEQAAEALRQLPTTHYKENENR